MRAPALLALASVAAGAAGYGGLQAYQHYHPAAGGLPAGFSDAPATYDPRDVAELEREGIPMREIGEIRELMRRALASPSLNERTAAASELKLRFGLDPDPSLYGRIERAGSKGPAVTLTEKGRNLVRSVANRVAALYDDLLKL